MSDVPGIAERNAADIASVEHVVGDVQQELAAAHKRYMDELQRISDRYYYAARKAHVHHFIEHAGLMNEHLKVMRDAAANGIDIHTLNVHNSGRFPMELYQAQYLAEKFSCMFTPYFDEASWRAFVESCERDGCGQWKAPG